MAVRIVYVCDECEEDFDTGCDDWRAASETLRQQKWKVFKEDDEWRHLCPDCK